MVRVTDSQASVLGSICDPVCNFIEILLNSSNKTLAMEKIKWFSCIHTF